jgi:hypothetical protein
MTPTCLADAEDIWCVDFEFCAPEGERPTPICLVAHELRQGRVLRLWEEELQRLRRPPYATGRRSLVVAYYASAELLCHLALAWPLPVYVLDLFAEFRVLTNGLPTPCGQSLLGALTYFGIDGFDAIEKEEMRQLALRGGPWTAAERRALLVYCESDVVALRKLLSVLAPHLDLPQALLRGRSMKAAAQMEWHGVPIDVEALGMLRTYWEDIQDQLIAHVDTAYGVFEGRTFKIHRWEQWLAARGIAWPRLPSGVLALDHDTFKAMARAYPEVNPLRELRASLSQMRLEQLTVGRDGRNRTLLSAFRAKTGRNQPSTTKFIFGPAVWLRYLIRPEPGYGVAYVDWSQQEFGIAAALSGDPVMLDAYRSGDPYLAFAKQTGVIPPDGTKTRYGAIREQYKACALAVQYGMGDVNLAVRLGQSPAVARALLQSHRHTYPKFWHWSDSVVDYAMLHSRLHTVFGWTVHLGPPSDPQHLAVNPRALRNFPMQANGAEMLRLACCLATERGIHVCAPIHDALLIEAPLDDLDHVIAETQRAMADASAAVLSGFALRSEAKVFRYPERYQDERGTHMWSLVWELLREHVPEAIRA